MTDEKQPWYKRWWVSLAALVLGVLGGIAAVVGKTLLTKKKMADAQKEDNKVLDIRMADKSEVGKAKLEAVNAEADLAKAKAEAEYKENTHALANKAKADAAKNAGSPDAASAALGSALDRATRRR
jgi:hypothetical protein